MQLITDKIYVEDFGDCKEMGRCGTCLVEVSGLKEQPALLERNEASTIRKIKPDNKNARLACQILINEHLNNATVRIINDWVQ
jgi:2Fe-2S ferredoxin